MKIKTVKRIMLCMGITLSMVFVFNVKVHVLAVTDDIVTVDDDPVTTTDDDDPVTVNNDNDENTNDDEEDNNEETTAKAQKGEEVAKGVKITDADNDNENNTVEYVANANDDQIDKNAFVQAKEVSKDPNVMKSKPMTDYTMSDHNTCWVPYWYWYTVMNNQSETSMPKKHPANVKTNKQNVNKYQNYVDKKVNRIYVEFSAIAICFITVVIVLAVWILKKA